MIVSFAMKIMSVLITVILYGRMIEIYLYVSVAPIPATVTNREWKCRNQLFKGTSRFSISGIFHYGVCAIYAVLVASVAVAATSTVHCGRWQRIP